MAKKKPLDIPAMIKMAEGRVCASELAQVKKLHPSTVALHRRAPYWAYWYCVFVNKGRRLPQIEPIILRSANWSFWYAKDVLKAPWPEAEPIFAADPYWSKRYNNEILQKG